LLLVFSFHFFEFNLQVLNLFIFGDEFLRHSQCLLPKDDEFLFQIFDFIDKLLLIVRIFKHLLLNLLHLLLHLCGVFAVCDQKLRLMVVEQILYLLINAIDIIHEHFM
jgi:hypothetical protein